MTQEAARKITEIMNYPNQSDFLVKLLHKINQEIQLAFMATYNQVCDAQEAAFILEPTIIYTMFEEMGKMFNQIVRNQISDFLLPASLDTDDQETQEEQVSVGRVSKKQKRLEKNDNASSTQNYKQKEWLGDLWAMPPELKFTDLFGDNNKGNELVAKICDYKFRHHQKKG